MNDKQAGTTLALLGLVIMSSVTAAAPDVSDGEGSLRAKMAGAWRGEQFGDVFNIDGDLCVMAEGSQQMLLTVQYEGDVARRTTAYTGMAVPGELFLRDGKLIVHIPSPSMEVSYVRLDTVPEAVRIDPYSLGTRSLDAGQLSAIRREIAQRSKKDQDIRVKSEGAGAGGNAPSPLQAMIAVDRENTLRLIDLIRDVGWLDAARFGKETQFGAFLIVQHSGNLRLMRTVLPLIEKEAKADAAIGQLYALLYDRLQMSLGKKQRYGTQISPSPTGGMTISRLEDRTRVDAWRREMRMEPLADYVRMASERNGTKITIGD